MPHHFTCTRAARTAAALVLGGILLVPVLAHATRLQEETQLAGEPTTDRLIIRYRGDTSRAPVQAAPGLTGETQASLFRSAQQPVEVMRHSVGGRVVRLERHTSVRRLEAVAQQLMAEDPAVLWAEPDYRMQTQAVASDPLFGNQWHYTEAKAGINLPPAWDLSTGSGVVVAVIDTGVRPHADLTANLLPGRDMISDTTVSQDGDGRDSDASDPGDGCNGGGSSWHGTHVAGTIAAAANNGLGGAGVAPNAKILPVRALGCGGGYNSDIADALVWASGGAVSGQPTNPNPAKVLNLSLGGTGPCSATMQSAINAARANGAVVVVAAGNSNALAGGFSPANCQNVITVAAVGRLGGRAPYSNYGQVVDIAAPGGNMATGAANGILSTLDSGATTPGGDTYQFYQGTSMATPHVSGVAALMLARRPDLKPHDIEVLLRSQTRAFPLACSGCGTGLLDAGKVMQALFLGATAGQPVTEVEPNNTAATAQLLSSAVVTVSGVMSPTKDPDLYKVPVPAGATLKLRLITNAESNYDLDLRQLNGALLASSARPAGLTDFIAWTNTSRTTMNVFPQVNWKAGGTGTVSGRYTLEIAR